MENRKARTRRAYRIRHAGTAVASSHGEAMGTAESTALLNAGVVDRVEGGGIVFPFEAVKVEFLLEAG